MRLSSALFRIGVLCVAALAPARAATIYDNTSVDTLITYFYSANGSTLLGDSIGFGGTERLLTNAAVQFYNGGVSAGSFSAMIQLYEAGAPAGPTVGSAVQVDNLNIGGMDILTVNFPFASLLVPDFVVFAVSVTNVSSGLDLGLNAFTGPVGPAGPPAVGTSNLGSLIVGAPLVTAATAAGEGNLYFLATADAASTNNIPEPGSLLLLSSGLLTLASLRFRR